mmetsp:Transcript_43634/g.83263  ORF Transcript_43634/g.83263 Transcript_43634/m.83263 type:complete len:204 (+) Transcript_43634:689-1300(+)
MSGKEQDPFTENIITPNGSVFSHVQSATLISEGRSVANGKTLPSSAFTQGNRVTKAFDPGTPGAKTVPSGNALNGSHTPTKKAWFPLPTPDCLRYASTTPRGTSRARHRLRSMGLSLVVALRRACEALGNICLMATVATSAHSYGIRLRATLRMETRSWIWRMPGLVTSMPLNTPSPGAYTRACTAHAPRWTLGSTPICITRR